MDTSISYLNHPRKSDNDYKIVEVKDNIVRVRSGLFVINVVVDYKNKRIQVPDGITAHHFNKLVGIVLNAFVMENNHHDTKSI